MILFALAARRFVESEAYKKARTDAGGNTGHLVAALREAGPVSVLDSEELAQALSLRTFSNLYPFSIDGKAYAGELPGAVNVPQAVETIPTTKEQVELGAEQSESMLATSVLAGQPLPEGQLNTGASAPTLQTVHPFGVTLAVAAGVLDDPGQMASFLNRRIELGLNLGLENDILNGNANWAGAIASVPGANIVAKSTYNVDAITNALADIQNNGWYSRPPQIVTWPTSKAKTYLERDSSQRPLGIIEMLADWVDPVRDGRPLIIPSKFVTPGTALVGDLFNAIALFVKGDLTVEVSRLHRDFLTRGMVEMKLAFRAHSWVREPGALALVTGIS